MPIGSWCANLIRCTPFYENFSHEFSPRIEELPITQEEKRIISGRYLPMVEEAEINDTRGTFLFNVLTNAITVFGVMITALVSIERASVVTHTDAIFWSIWTMSIALTIANRWVSSYNVHKKYILARVVVEKLKTEGWQFIAGIDKYKNVQDPTERFKLFMTRIEKINQRLVQALASINDGSNATQNTTNDTAQNISGYLATNAPPTNAHSPVRMASLFAVHADAQPVDSPPILPFHARDVAFNVHSPTPPLMSESLSESHAAAAELSVQVPPPPSIAGDATC